MKVKELVRTMENGKVERISCFEQGVTQIASINNDQFSKNVFNKYYGDRKVISWKIIITDFVKLIIFVGKKNEK